MDLDFNICLRQCIYQSCELRSMSLSEVCKNVSSLAAGGVFCHSRMIVLCVLHVCRLSGAALPDA